MIKSKDKENTKVFVASRIPKGGFIFNLGAIIYDYFIILQEYHTKSGAITYKGSSGPKKCKAHIPLPLW